MTVQYTIHKREKLKDKNCNWLYDEKKGLSVNHMTENEKRKRLELQFIFTYKVDIWFIISNISNHILGYVHRKNNDTYEETSYEKLSKKSCIQILS